MQALNYTPRIFTVVSLLALAACELPTKLGNFSDSATATDATGSASGESTSKDSDYTTGSEPGETSAWSTTSTTSTTGPSETWSTTAQTTSGGSETTIITGPISDTDMAHTCEQLGEADCESEPCMPLYGVAYDFPGCSKGQVFLGCIEPTGCDDAETTFCKQGTEEAYKRQNGCVPPGFTECEAPTPGFCGSCEALDEAGCLADPVDCQPIYGAPHVEVAGEMCVDYEALKFLLCIANGGECPPFVPTLCPIGSPEEAYDVPSGCMLPGFEACEGAGAPQCP